MQLDYSTVTTITLKMGGKKEGREGKGEEGKENEGKRGLGHEIFQHRGHNCTLRFLTMS